MPQTLEPLLRSHKFFAGLDPAYLTLIASCAKNAAYPAGTFLFREGEPADKFYLVRNGKLALEYGLRLRAMEEQWARWAADQIRRGAGAPTRPQTPVAPRRHSGR